MSKMVLTLTEDECDEDFGLIALSSSLEAYLLAFKVNQALNLKLKRSRADFDVKFKNKMAYFAVFEREDEEGHAYFRLIKNQAGNVIRELARTPSQGLFDEMGDERARLIPKLKPVDYLLKFKTEQFTEEEILRNLKKIPGVALAYLITDPKIRSHKNLIFN